MGRGRKISDVHAKIIRWLVNNTPLGAKDIHRYCEINYDIKSCYETINLIKRGVVCQDIPGEINVDCPDLQRYITLCHSTNFSEGIERCIVGKDFGGSNNYRDTSFFNNGPITDKMFSHYLEAKKNGWL